MNCFKNTVLISSFANSASNADVIEFLRPFRAADIRLLSNNHDGRVARKVAFVDFDDEATAQAFVAQKDDSHFSGSYMRVRLAPPNRNNNQKNRQTTENRPPSQSQGNGRLQNLSRANTKTKSETRKGSFKIIAFGSGSRLVALETGWQPDQDRLADDLEEYAGVVACGVEEINPDTIYACRDHETWSMQRCRKICEASEGSLFVELVDQGRQQMVSIDQLWMLSSLFTQWTIKAVELDFEGFAIAPQSPDRFERVKTHIFDQTFELTYQCERRGALKRDRLQVSDMKLNGESVLEELVRKGVLVRC